MFGDLMGMMGKLKEAQQKVEETKLKQAMFEISHLKGASKKKTTEEEYERMRKIGFEKIFKGLK